MLRWQDVLQFEFLGNPVVNWGLAVVTFLVTLTVLPIIKGFHRGAPPVAGHPTISCNSTVRSS